MAFSQEWISILNKVSEFTNNTEKDRVWFRGHNNINYELNSGLFRLELGNEISEYKDSETSAYNRFHISSQTLITKNSWDLLYIMQHHGVRTRLLDWTESFAISLYFALKNWEHTKQDACIWMLDPIKLNKKSLDRSTIVFPKEEFRYPNEFFKKNITHSFALAPNQNNPRIIAQKGFFTVQGNGLQPLENEFNGDLQEQSVLEKITLNQNILPDAEKFLKICGIDEFILFPDLEGLAQVINKKMELTQIPIPNLSLSLSL
ncbi:FRG domain-containing protein [Bacillus toyonensis]|nr:FRG domain-containing protein [Bacillus toyonensis]